MIKTILFSNLFSIFTAISALRTNGLLNRHPLTIMKKIFSTSVSIASLSLALLLLRIGVAALMFTHGIPKLEKVLAGDFAFGDPLGIGVSTSLVLTVLSEVGCSLLLLLGVGTRLAVLPLIFTMLVAILVVHADDPFGNKELALFYLLIYLVLLILGSGRYSIDYQISRRNP